MKVALRGLRGRLGFWKLMGSYHENYHDSLWEVAEEEQFAWFEMVWGMIRLLTRSTCPSSYRKRSSAILLDISLNPYNYVTFKFSSCQFCAAQFSNKDSSRQRRCSDFELNDNEAIYDARNSIDCRMNRILEKISRDSGIRPPYYVSSGTSQLRRDGYQQRDAIEMLSKLLGHSSIISTEKTYARFLRSTVDTELKKLIEWQ